MMISDGGPKAGAREPGAREPGAAEAGARDAGVLWKVCGITDEAGADTAVRVGADALGFIFYAESPRSTTPEAAEMTSASMSFNFPVTRHLSCAASSVGAFGRRCGCRPPVLLLKPKRWRHRTRSGLSSWTPEERVAMAVREKPSTGIQRQVSRHAIGSFWQAACDPTTLLKPHHECGHGPSMWRLESRPSQVSRTHRSCRRLRRH